MSGAALIIILWLSFTILAGIGFGLIARGGGARPEEEEGLCRKREQSQG